MIREITTVCLLMVSLAKVYAQPANDNCAGAITVLSNGCSTNGQYTLTAATSSGFGTPTCWSGTNQGNNDVWFQFVATATDLTVTVNGNTGAGGGTLQRPHVALYTGSCSGTIAELMCGSAAAGDNSVQIYRGALVPGTTYLIRVDAHNTNVGTFQLCLSNYFPVPTPNGDCPSGVVLCDKSSFVVQSVTGTGNNALEMDDATCFGSTFVESNSTWYVFAIQNAGTFTFNLTPTNPNDDLDFALYRLPNGIGNCSGKLLQRCMASSCVGSTGLNTTSTDTNEPSGCSAGQDNWLSQLNVTAGQVYALAINNFTSTGNGFTLSFGGTCTFQGPTADFSFAPTNVCVNQPFTFTNASTIPSSVGTITNWDWVFGTGSTPATANTVGAHSVTYNSPNSHLVTLTVTSNRGCRVSVQRTVNVSQAPAVSTTATNPTCSQNNGSVNLTTTGGTGPFTYLWSNGAVTQNLAGVGAGTYTVTVTGAGTCTTVTSAALTSSGAVSVTIGMITQPNCSDTGGGINITPSGGIAPYTYLWSNGATTQNLSNLSGGGYTVTVTSQDGCAATATASLTPPVIPSVSISGTNVICANQTTTFTASGANSYLWSTGSTSATITPFSASNYTVTGFSSTGCSATATRSLTINPNPTVTVVGANIICGGTPVNIAATGGFSNYTWTTPSGTATGMNQVASLPGAYIVTVSDGNGCQASASLTVSGFAVTATADVAICRGQSTTLGASTGWPAAVTYAWSPSTGLNNTNVQNPIANPTVSTTYTVTASIATPNLVVNGDFSQGNTGFTTSYAPGSGGTWGLLSNEGQFAINTNPRNTHNNFCIGGDHTTGAGNMLIANGSSIAGTTVWCQTIAVSPNSTYNFSAWANSVDPQNPADLQFSVNGVQIGSIFNLTTTTCLWQQFNAVWNSGAATNATICILSQNTQVGGNDFALDDISFALTSSCTATDQVVVTVNPLPVVGITGPASICAGQSATFDAGVGFSSYSWTTPAGTQTGQTVTASQAGTYRVTVTNANGCSATASRTLTVNSAPTVVISGASFICGGNTSNLSATAGFTSYSWTTPTGTASGANISASQPGTYTVIVTAANGCTGTANRNLTVFAVTATPDVTICAGQSTTLGASTSGTGTINYTWSPGTGLSSPNVQNPLATPASSITYTVTAAIPSSNIVVNGDFSSGNTGFTTDHTPGTGGSFGLLSNNGTYAVTTNPIAAHTNFCSGVDHTSGTGNMLILNGLATAGATVWCQNIPVTPNTSYDLSAWAMSCVAGSPASLQFRVNGVALGTQFNLTSTTCLWQQFSTNWNSGAATTASVCIITLNPVFSGNDFAVDDIVFSRTPCTTTDQVVVTVNPNPTPSIVGAASACQGSATTFDAGAGFANYSWTTPAGVAATQTVSTNATGNYRVTVTDNNGCSGIANRNFTLNNNPTPSISGTTTICQGGATTLDGGLGFNGYFWATPTGNETTRTINANAAGTYTVVVTDANGCTGSASVTLTVLPNPTVTITGIDTVCTGGSSTFDAGAGFATYAWNGPSGTSAAQTVAVSLAGTYTVTVTDANGCTASRSRVLVVIANPTVVASSNSPLCEGATLNLTATTSATNFTWVGPNSFNSNLSNPSVSPISLLDAGVYSVTVSDANGCSGTNSVSVVVNSLPTANITGNNQICAGTTTQFDAGLGYNDYSWTTPTGNLNTQVITISQNGIYSVTVTDINGCTGQASRQLTVFPLPAPTITGNNSICVGENTTFDAGASFVTYNWTTPTGVGTTQAVTANTAGTYSVTVTDANGCSGSDNRLLTVNATPVLSVASNSPVCIGADIQLSVTGASTYSWSGPNNFVGLGSNVTIPNAALVNGGIYQVTGTVGNGCSATGSVSVTISAGPTLAASATAVSCFGGCDGSVSISATGNSPFNYFWSGGLISAPSHNAVCAGTYNVTVVDGVGCATTESNIVVITPPALLASVISVVDMSCYQVCDGQINLDVFGGTAPYTYNWTPNVFPRVEDPSNLCSGNYALTISDANGCSFSLSNMLVDEPTQIVVSTLVQNPRCYNSYDGTVRAVVGGGSPGYIFNWDSSPAQNGQMATGLGAGTYRLTVTDRNGCQTVTSANLTAPSQIQATVVGDTVSCWYSTDGTAIATPSGGTPSYNLLWDNGNAGQFTTGLAAGPHFVSITDANGCQERFQFTITSPPPLLVYNNSLGNVSCFGETDGHISVNPQGGTPGYEYYWSNGQQTSQVQNLPAGSYRVTVTDRMECSVTGGPFIIAQPTLMQTSTQVLNQISCHGGSDGRAQINTSGGSPAYSYNWDHGATGRTLNNLTVGPYIITVTDANGCQNVTNLTITEPIALDADVLVAPANCFGEDGTITITVDSTSGPVPYQYSFDGGISFNSGNENFFPAGPYTVVVEDANGCTYTEAVNISQPLELIVEVNPADTLIGLGTSVQLSTLVVNGQVVANYQWSPADSLSCENCPNPLANPTSTTTYNLTVTDAAGCMATAQSLVRLDLSRNVFIPSGFTPNGDDHNDVFMVYAGEGVSHINRMVISDRWGEIVFDLNGPFPPTDDNYGWDGLFKGQEMMSGTFVFMVEVVFEDGFVKKYTGDISLLR